MREGQQRRKEVHNGRRNKAGNAGGKSAPERTGTLHAPGDYAGEESGKADGSADRLCDCVRGKGDCAGL